MSVFKRWYNRKLRDMSIVKNIKEAIRMYEDGLYTNSVEMLEYAIRLIKKKIEQENDAN